MADESAVSWRLEMNRMVCALIVPVVLGMAGAAHATPSSTIWTNCSIDFQSPRLTRLGIDTYNRFGDPAKDNVSQLPTDYGPEFGKALTKKGLSLEYGFDYFSPAKDPLFFNAKIGFPEGTLSSKAPALELGFFNFGTKSGVTNQDIVHLITGKSLPHNLGRLHASLYAGNGSVLRSSAGKKENTGFMLAYDKMLASKWWCGADYASGKNSIGGYSAAVGYYFTKDISVLAGPVWFNDKGLNGKMKVTVQLDLNF